MLGIEEHSKQPLLNDFQVVVLVKFTKFGYYTHTLRITLPGHDIEWVNVVYSGGYFNETW